MGMTEARVCLISDWLVKCLIPLLSSFCIYRVVVVVVDFFALSSCGIIHVLTCLRFHENPPWEQEVLTFIGERKYSRIFYMNSA